MSEELEAPKPRALKYVIIASLALNLAFGAEHGIAYLGAKTGFVHADVEFDGLSVGGGTSQHAAREQQLAALETALPVKALTPPPAVQTPPLPQRKPSVK